MNIFVILFVTFVFMVLFVGGYVYMFLHIMRNDPREIEFRKNSDEDSSLVPHKYDDEKRKSSEKIRKLEDEKMESGDEKESLQIKS